MSVPFQKTPPAQQAGILCNDPRFQQFVGSRIIKSGASVNASGCAEYIRQICAIASRRALNTDATARAKFETLRTEFDAWTGRIGKPDRSAP
jgi:hypothetical protein